MSDFTGINVGEVTSNLDNFKTEIDAIINDFSVSFQSFNSDLYNYWASERAVEFNSHLVELALAYNQTVSNLYEILFAAGTAAAEMAKSNGALFNNKYDVIPKDKIMTDYYGLLSESDGIKGMNLFRVKWAYEDFSDKINEIISKLNNLPVAFGLYDPKEELQKSYELLIKKTVEGVESAVNGIVTAINDALQNETNQITLGMGIALSELGG